MNKGVCQPLLQNYRCLCLEGSYSNEHCEATAYQLTVRRMISRSVAYVVIIVMISTAGFIVILDILKYCFDIDPGKKATRLKKKKKHIIAIRFIYVNAPPTQSTGKDTHAQISLF